MCKKDLTAPCGIDCFNCDLFELNLDESKKEMYAKAFNLAVDHVACKGCRVQGGCRLHWQSCETFDCVKERGMEFCFECSDFPCGKLMPCADGAGKYPHNMKLYNLCRMKQIGVEEWAEREAAEIRKKYFKGKFVVGSGPDL
ncbi:MAG: DUF3795 domain-containing protein [Clostridia bacterium]|nr:DUF3795 domain-containing protein [Clostridia bacterium]